MSRIVRHYYLYKLLLWTVVIEGDEVEVEESEELPGTGLTSHFGQPGEIPDFGFTPFTRHWIEEEE